MTEHVFLVRANSIKRCKVLDVIKDKVVYLDGGVAEIGIPNEDSWLFTTLNDARDSLRRKIIRDIAWNTKKIQEYTGARDRLLTNLVKLCGIDDVTIGASE